MKSCKLCEKERYGTSSWCRSHFFERERAKKEAKRLKKKEKRENSYKRVSTRAWSGFARSVKEDNVNFQGYVECYTCGKLFYIGEIQAGHCFHRGRQRYKALDFDKKHIRPQCRGCNMDKQGQRDIFQAKLTRELGLEAVEHMIWRRHNEPALTIEELKEIANKYNV